MSPFITVRNEEEYWMVQRIVEMIAGVCASVFGLLILFSLFSASFTGQAFTNFPLDDLTWLPAFLAYVTVLAVIALGALLHGIPSLTHARRRARVAFAWVGRLALWLATAGFIILAYLSEASIGLIFIPSAVLALTACLLSLIPGPAHIANN